MTLQGRSPRPGQEGTADPATAAPPPDAAQGPGRAGKRLDTAELLARLARARKAHNWQAYQAGLEALAASGSPSAQQALLDIMGDAETTFEGRVGRIFHKGLKGADLQGIAEAARMRFEQQISAGRTSWVAADGWFDVVADHGDEIDIAWLRARSESKQIRSAAEQALAKSQNPAAVRLVLKRLRDPSGRPGDKRQLAAFVKHHPKAGLELLSDLIERALTGGEPLRGMSKSDLMRSFGKAVPPDRLPEAKALLQRLRTEADRLAAVYAVQALHRRGLNTGDLDGIVRAPEVALAELRYDERAPDSPKQRALSGRAYAAMYAIEYNHVAWSETRHGPSRRRWSGCKAATPRCVT